MRFLYVHRDDIRRWQIETLAIQQVIQKILDDYGIMNWCGGGTLLGLKRNAGFLYWDNDLDMFFRYKDYKNIMMAFWETKLLKEYDLYYYRKNHWQKNHSITELLMADKLNSNLMMFELSDLSEGMFKLFSKAGIEVRLFNNDFNKPEDYVKIKHFSPIHLTRHRLAYRDDSIENGAIYTVLPNVCMLPMIEMNYNKYLSFLLRYSAGSIIKYIAKFITFPEINITLLNPYDKFQYADIKQIFDPGALDSMDAKIKLMLKNLCGGISRYVKSSIQQRYKGNSGRFIVYKPTFFRYYVMPFLLEDIFPLQKNQFEGVTINVPYNIHNVLKTQFGDYMQVPKINDRIAYPFFIKDRMDK